MTLLIDFTNNSFSFFVFIFEISDCIEQVDILFVERCTICFEMFVKKEILSLGVQAITGSWANYSRSELQIPTADTRISGSMGFWIWVVDYQLAAQTLQKELYGETNIELEENRKTLIDVYRGIS